jgi:O-antigen/teichoic acid export membrane protein
VLRVAVVEHKTRHRTRRRHGCVNPSLYYFLVSRVTGSAWSVYIGYWLVAGAYIQYIGRWRADRVGPVFVR